MHCDHKRLLEILTHAKRVLEFDFPLKDTDSVRKLLKANSTERGTSFNKFKILK